MAENLKTPEKFATTNLTLNMNFNLQQSTIEV